MRGVRILWLGDIAVFCNFDWLDVQISLATVRVSCFFFCDGRSQSEKDLE